jgi:putative two-component system response regulator
VSTDNPLISTSYDEPRSVLIVDDETPIRCLLARYLRDDGWDCTQAENAERAIERLEAASFAMVVTDINMPGRSGLWLLQQIIARWPQTSVLMLTASSDTRCAIDSLTLGAAGYMLKPIHREQFIIQVRRAWEQRQLILERRNYLEMLERRVQEQTAAIRLAHEETIHRLVVAAGWRDEETGAHIRRTGLFSEVLALAAGWSVREADQLRMAAPMHDVGKIGIPDAILKKPGKLTPEEFEVMKEHTLIGARMLAGSASPVLQLAESIALCHHERWDGAGYPHRTAGESIPEAARILAIVDVYDALSHDRVYRPAWPEEKVLATLREGQGAHFDPRLLAHFFACFEEIRAINEANPDDAEEDQYLDLPAAPHLILS